MSSSSDTRSPRWLALRTGASRGWTLFRHIMTTKDGIANTIIWNGIPLGILILNRDSNFPGTSISLATVAMPGFLGLMVAAGALGPAYNLAAEREDGTLLRAKAVPFGMLGYVTGIIVLACLETAVSLFFVLVPGLILFDGLALGSPLELVAVLALILLGLIACLPMGIVIGSLIRSPRVIGGFFLFVVGALTYISGIMSPLQSMWTWIQWVSQALPLYWLSLGMRSIFLPAEAVAQEIGGSWRTWEMLAVLVAWAAVGFVLAPRLLKRMANRESGSSLEAHRQKFLQRMN